MNFQNYPEAIIILAGAVVTFTDDKGKMSYHSATYDDCDAFGTVDGRARVEAGAALSKIFPEAIIVAMDDLVIPDELKELGVGESRLLIIKRSLNTSEEIKKIAEMIKEKNWKKIVVVTNEYHLPRASAFYDSVSVPEHEVEFISAEEALSAGSVDFQTFFERVKKTPAYLKRLESEKRGLEAFKRGEYKPASLEAKKER